MSYDAGAVTYRVDADTKQAIDGFDKLDKTLDDTDKGMKKVDQSSNKLNTTLKTLAGSIAAAFSVNAIKDFILTTSAAIDEQFKFAQRIGISYEELQKLQFAASQTGVGLNNLNTGLQRMTRRLETIAQGGAPEVRKQLEALGIAVEDIVSLSPDEQFRMIADAMAGLDNEAQRVTAAFALFDTEGVALVNTLRDGSRSIDDLGNKLSSVGGIISDETAKAAADFNDQLDIMQRSVTGVSSQIAANLLPAAKNLASIMTDLVSDTQAVENIIKGVGVAAQVTAAVLAGKLISALGSFVAKAGRAVAAGQALTVVATGLTRAMSFLGGPAGVILIAAIAMKGFVDETTKATNSTDLLTKSTEDLTKAQAKLMLLNIGDAIEEATKEMEKQQRIVSAVTNGFGALSRGSEENTRKITEANAAYDEQAQKVEKLKQKQQELQDILSGKTETKPKPKSGTTVVNQADVDAIDRYADVTAELSNQFRVLQLQASGLNEEALKLNDQFTAEKLLGGTGTPQQIEDVVAALEGIRRVQGEIEAQEDAMREIEGYYRTFGNAAANAIGDVATGVKDLDDALKDMANTLITTVANSLIQSGINSLIGGASGGLFSFLGFGRSTGGPMSPNSTYRVNEVGTEGIVTSAGGSQYYTPLTSGQSVATANQMQGGGGTMVNVNVQNNAPGVEVNAQQNGDSVDIVIQQISRQLQSGRGEIPRSLELGYDVPRRRS